LTHLGRFEKTSREDPRPRVSAGRKKKNVTGENRRKPNEPRPGSETSGSDAGGEANELFAGKKRSRERFRSRGDEAPGKGSFEKKG
jgi:hypothetical protein